MRTSIEVCLSARFRYYRLHKPPLKLSYPGIVLDQFSSKHPYGAFVFDHANYAKKIERVKHLRIEKEEEVCEASPPEGMYQTVRPEGWDSPPALWKKWKR